MGKLRMLRVVLAIAWPLIVTAEVGAEDRGASKLLGNCFDVAFHEKSNRLFVAGCAAGLHVFGVKDGRLNFVTTMTDGGYYRRLVLAGDRAYVADSRRGLVVLDIAGKDPVCTWQQQDVQGMGLAVRENLAYLAAGAAGLQIFDISTPDSPQRVGLCQTNGVARDVWVGGRHAYVADEQQGLTVVDVSLPSRPRKVALMAWDTEKPVPQTVRGEGNRIYVAAGKDGLVVIDISNPRKPKLVRRYEPSQSGLVTGLAAKDGLLYLANVNHDNQQENGLVVLETRGPQAVKMKTGCAFGGNVEGVCRAGHYVFIANTFSGIRSIDVRDPNHLQLADRFGPTEEPGQAETEQVAFCETEISPRERELIDYLVKTKAEVLQGRKFHDLSTPVNALLTLVSAYQNRDPNTVTQVMPLARQYTRMTSPETGARFLGFWGKATVFRVEVEDKSPQESDLGAIYTGISSDQKMDQIIMFAYIQGAWRFVAGAGGASSALRNWRPDARQNAAATRDILQKQTEENR